MLTALMPRSRVKVLSLLLLRAGTDHYLREVARLSAVPLRAAQRELARLTSIGLVAPNRRGHQVFFKVDTHHPLFADLRSLLAAGDDVVVPLRAALSAVAGIEAAALAGPASGDAVAAPQALELLVVGTPDPGALRAALAAIEADLGRKVVASVFAPRRRAAKRRRGSASAKPLIPIVGDLDAIE